MIQWCRKHGEIMMDGRMTRPPAIQGRFRYFSLSIYDYCGDNTRANFKGGCFMTGFHIGGFLGYLRPRSRLYWPPYLQRFAASSVISGIQLANTAYTPTIIRCRQNRPLTWIFLYLFFFSFSLFARVSVSLSPDRLLSSDRVS